MATNPRRWTPPCAPPRPRPAGGRQAHADLLQNRHRHGLAQQGRHARCTRRRPGCCRGGRHPRGAGLEHAPFEIPADIAQAWNAWSAARRPKKPGVPRFEAYRTHYPRRRPSSSAAWRVICCRHLRTSCQTCWLPLPPTPAAFATRKSSQNALDVLGTLAAGVLWRQCRSDRLQPDQLQGLRQGRPAAMASLCRATI
jgi:hypothetical protein